MKLMQERIREHGIIENGDILKVGSFLNQQIDVPFISKCADEFYRLFKDSQVTKILTIEASGIGLACLCAIPFSVPVVFAKKSASSNMTGSVYSAKAYSFTHGNTNNIIVPCSFIKPEDRILIIDDFLANGEALRALVSICADAGATVVGAGIFIEKVFQGGGDALRAQGLRIESLAKISSLSVTEGATFCD